MDPGEHKIVKVVREPSIRTERGPDSTDQFYPSFSVELDDGTTEHFAVLRPEGFLMAEQELEGLTVAQAKAKLNAVTEVP